jgi:hypothetical protein
MSSRAGIWLEPAAKLAALAGIAALSRWVDATAHRECRWPGRLAALGLMSWRAVRPAGRALERLRLPHLTGYLLAGVASAARPGHGERGGPSRPGAHQPPWRWPSSRSPRAASSASTSCARVHARSPGPPWPRWRWRCR